MRTGFAIPEELGVPSVEAALGSSRALTIAETFDLMDPALDWASLEELAAEAGVPVLVKGVLTGEDGALAVEHGAAGVIVSNHGGRQLDRCLATADALPEVVEAVAAGRRCWSTAASAAASTSRSRSPSAPTPCSSARPALWGLAAGGEAGALRVLELLRDELELTLALCGCPTPAELGRSHLQRAPAAYVYSV